MPVVINELLALADTSSCSAVDVPSLLSRLRCPAPSDLSRKRKLKSNPPKGVKHGKGAVTVQHSIHPTTRIQLEKIYLMKSESFELKL